MAVETKLFISATYFFKILKANCLKILMAKYILDFTSQMTQGTRRLYSEVEVKAKAEVKIVVRS